MKYCPTPWSYNELDACLDDANGDYITSIIDAGKINAQRIVSCVNGCQRIENPEAIKELIEVAKDAKSVLDAKLGWWDVLDAKLEWWDVLTPRNKEVGTTLVKRLEKTLAKLEAK